MKTDKEKAQEILRKRKLAAEGLEQQPDGGNPLEDPDEKKEEQLGDEALTVDLGLKR